MNILVVGPSWIGDMVMAQSLLIELKLLHPNSNIDILAPAWSLSVTRFMPEVRKRITMPVGHGSIQLATRHRVAEELKSDEYDWAIVLANTLKSALIPWFANIPKRSGWRGELRYGLINQMHKAKKPLVAAMPMKEYYARLAYAPDTDFNVSNFRNPSFVVPLDLVDTVKDKFGVDVNQNALAICPGAEYGDAKHWPRSNFAQIASLFISECRGQVFLFGGGSDKSLCDDIEQAVKDELGHGKQRQVINCAGKTTLEESVTLMSLCSASVNNDSGLMHVAAALGIPLVAIYGSTSPERTPPLSNQCSIEYLQLQCSPCYQKTCPYGHFDCLRKISVARVWSSLKQYLPAQTIPASSGVLA